MCFFCRIKSEMKLILFGAARQDSSAKTEIEEQGEASSSDILPF